MSTISIDDATINYALSGEGPDSLVLAGRHDRLRLPDYVKGIAQRVPGAALQELDSGHIMPMQAAAMTSFYAENRCESR